MLVSGRKTLKKIFKWLFIHKFDASLQIYYRLLNKSAVKNKVKKKKEKHVQHAAVNLLAIRILNNSVMYSRFSLRFKEI